MTLPLRAGEADHSPEPSLKQPGAFRTISEVADELDLPQHVLRFWETRFAPVRPVKRAGGRRFYRPQDVDLLRGLRRLLYSKGYTIRGAQLFLREKGVRAVQAIGRGESGSVPDVDQTPEHRTLLMVLDELQACRTALAELQSLHVDE